MTNKFQLRDIVSLKTGKFINITTCDGVKAEIFLKQGSKGEITTLCSNNVIVTFPITEDVFICLDTTTEEIKKC